MAQLSGKITGLFLSHIRYSQTNLLPTRSSTNLCNEIKLPQSQDSVNTSEESSSTLCLIKKRFNYTTHVSTISSGVICKKITNLQNIEKNQKDIINRSALKKIKVDIPKAINIHCNVHTSANLSRHGDTYMRTKIWDLSKDMKEQMNHLEEEMKKKFGKPKYDDPSYKVKNRYTTYSRVKEMKGLCKHDRFCTGYKKCAEDDGICFPCRVQKPLLSPCRPIARVELTHECPRCPKCLKQEAYKEFNRRKAPKQ